MKNIIIATFILLILPVITLACPIQQQIAELQARILILQERIRIIEAQQVSIIQPSIPVVQVIPQPAPQLLPYIQQPVEPLPVLPVIENKSFLQRDRSAYSLRPLARP